jgi:hypothetical protein
MKLRIKKVLKNSLGCFIVLVFLKNGGVLFFHFFSITFVVFRFTIKIFWVDDKKYGNDLIETIDFYDELEIMIKIVRGFGAM